MHQTTVPCPPCGADFTPPESLQRTMKRVAEQGHGLVMLECPHCLADWAWKPQADAPQQAPCRCPVSHCSGWVSHVQGFEEGDFWGCGECGAFWREKKNLDRDIGRIQQQYPYRSPCYIPAGDGQWRAAPWANEPPDDEQRVEKEPMAIHGKYPRD